MNQETEIQTVLAFRNKIATDPNWNSWKFQLQNRIKREDLEKFFVLSDLEKKGIRDSIRLNVGATPYYALLADPQDTACPIRKTIIPGLGETILSPEESPDPLHEERLSPVKGLTRMYDDRVLLFSNQECSVYCRHCMRGRKVSFNEERMDKDDLDAAFHYLISHPEISDVVISGGDPLNLSDSRIDYILENLEKIPSIKICRIGTRNLVTLPMRITDDLCKIIESHNNDNLSIFCNTHFNHEKECTQESKAAILKLIKCGVSVGNQCVILKGINDSGESMLALHKKLLEMRVRAYYMYDPEIIPGSRSFRTPLAKGYEIIEYMRGKISGMGIPQFVNDLPGGGGKITLTPRWYYGFHRESRQHIFRSALRGTFHLSPEPFDSKYDDTYEEVDLVLWEKIKSEAKSVHNA
ncbi:MAG: KamA family radical SAM protein [Leptospiraceae bacterium]|nr:KamA family radical SAM protein [Leptospiraceae bacterium]